MIIGSLKVLRRNWMKFNCYRYGSVSKALSSPKDLSHTLQHPDNIPGMTVSVTLALEFLYNCMYL